MIRSVLLLFTVSGILASQATSQDASSIIEPGAKVVKLAGGMKFTEGPAWFPSDQKLIFSDIPNSRLMQWTEKAGLTEFRESEQANGNILDLKGRLISCQHAGRNVIRTEVDGSITVLADKFDGKRFNSPNDVAVWKDGSLWFTDPAWGLRGPHELTGHWVFKLQPESGEIDVVMKDLAMPNGIVFSPDWSRIYVADTGGHAKHPDSAFHKLPDGIYCHEISEDGMFGKRLFTIPAGSDGMAVDVKGNIFSTHDGKVIVYDRDGKHIESISVPEGPANVCFGGKDMKTLFITARTSLYSLRVATAGWMPSGS